MPGPATGDTVAADVRTARTSARALAALIDVAAAGVGCLVAVTLAGLALGGFDGVPTALPAAVAASTAVGYPLAFETLTGGRSPGKIAMGLRVVSDDGSPQRFRQALVRALAAVVEVWALAGAPAAVRILKSQRGKRFGDALAGTVVIDERGPAPVARRAAPAPPPAPAMPPALAWWASSLELSKLRPDTAELARQFLVRAPQLGPHTRQLLAYRVSGAVLAQTFPPPPPDAPIEAVLAAVLAERQRRTPVTNPCRSIALDISSTYRDR